jgi:hypothetical protein
MRENFYPERAAIQGSATSQFEQKIRREFEQKVAMETKDGK